MADLKKRLASADFSLDQLNDWARQREETLGPMVKSGFSSNPKKTVATFDMDQDPPAKQIVISVDAGGGQPNPIFKGKAYIVGALTNVVAHRG